MVLEVLANSIRQEKEMKHKHWKKGSKSYNHLLTFLFIPKFKGIKWKPVTNSREIEQHGLIYDSYVLS